MRGMVTESSINNLFKFKNIKIQSLDWVHSVITLLDIPLLNNSEAPLQERLESFKTLKDEGVDTERGFNEILNSPVFRNFVISEDGKTSGIIVYIKKDELKDIENKSAQEIEEYKDTLKKEKIMKNITQIREVIKTYGDVGKIYLGGIPMITDDMMSFIKSDIIVFGLGVLLFIIATLWFIFRKLIWIIVPISSCFFFSFNYDRSTWPSRLEGYRYILKLYCFNVNSNYGNEYSYEYPVSSIKRRFSKFR